MQFKRKATSAYAAAMQMKMYSSICIRNANANEKVQQHMQPQCKTKMYSSICIRNANANEEVQQHMQPQCKFK
jgi:hypothetical protein